MKTQSVGWSGRQYGTWCPVYDPRGPGARAKAVAVYQKNRTNGDGDVDKPSRRFPNDGKWSDWLKRPLPGDGPGIYRVRYTEGAGDREWMQEMDCNYLARLARESKWEEFDSMKGDAWPVHLTEFVSNLEALHRETPEQREARVRAEREEAERQQTRIEALEAEVQRLRSEPRTTEAGAGSGAGSGSEPAAGLPSPVAASPPVPARAGSSITAVSLFQSLGRVWQGQYGQPRYVPEAEKPAGSAIGAIYRKDPTKPDATGPGKLWLGKTGFSTQSRDERERRTHSLIRRGSSLDSIREKVAADAYQLLAQGQYIVPKHRLANLPVINDFTRSNVLAQTLFEEMNRGRTPPIEESLHLMSKWVEGYQNLEQAKVKAPGDTLIPMMTYIETHRRIPEQIVVEGHEIPLTGVIEILAAARLLGDTDVLGGGGKNAGFVIERDPAERPILARAVKIDAGNAWNFEGADNRFAQCFNRRARPATRLGDHKDIQFGNLQTVDIEWDKLSDLQRETFVKALKIGLETLRTPLMMRTLIDRSGEFNRIEAGLLTPAIVDELAEVWQSELELQESDEVYGAELSAVVTLAP